MFLQELLNSNLVVPSTFNIGPFTIAFYALCILTGIVVGMYLVLREAKRVGISSDDVYFFAVITIPVAIVCARIWYVLFNISSFSNFGEVLGFKNGEFTGLSGLAIQGGIIGAVMLAEAITPSSLSNKSVSFGMFFCF
jgi:phosphatidylglycerol:prolipoprotein diacylglycerol transferase